ncbi:MAG: hypothetical protein IPO87_14820 [Flavobacteriales bacterium]|nr:hypothetical protein [Flavobacteriales bacterium]
MTLRPNTERPSTISIGSNELVPLNIVELRAAIARIEEWIVQRKVLFTAQRKDGHATERMRGCFGARAAMRLFHLQRPA